MFNMNSPTLQAMLQNVPQGVGNMPVYSGSTPTITTSQQQFTSPYPSPKDMVIQSAQQPIYAPVGFGYPQNIVGGYNPNIQHNAFYGYSNPYMGYGSYGGYGYPQYMMDETTRAIYNVAEMKGITYQEHVESQITLNQCISSFVSKFVGRTEEEAKRYHDYHDPRLRTQPQEAPKVERKPVKLMHVRIKCGDTVIKDIKHTDINVANLNLIKTRAVVDRLEYDSFQERMRYRYLYQRMYELAPERVTDGMDLAEFFTHGFAAMSKRHDMEDIKIARITNAANVYNKDKFRELVYKNIGIKPKSATTAVERYMGRYGLMPNGRPTTPGLDPSVAQSFSYNLSTGQYEVKPPNFLSSKIEAARQSFIQTLDIG